MDDLESCRGLGTSMISLLIPPGGTKNTLNLKYKIIVFGSVTGDHLARTARMLTNELGTAACIKSSSNRKSVIGAITSAQQKLKMYKRGPTNGLAIFCGTFTNDDGKSKKINLDMEPMKPITRSMYHCDNRFHVEELQKQLQSHARYGFVIVDGNGCLLAALQGSSREVLHQFSVDLPKKHGRGGQSANRFARLGQEARRNYIRKVAETTNSIFLNSDGFPNINGLILGGSAEIKNVLESSGKPKKSQKIIYNTENFHFRPFQ